MPFPALVSYASAVLHIEKPRASCGAIALGQSRQKLAAHERKNKPLNGLPESAHHLTRSGFRTRRSAASPDHLQKPGAPLCRARSSRRLTACSRCERTSRRRYRHHVDSHGIRTVQSAILCRPAPFSRMLYVPVEPADPATPSSFQSRPGLFFFCQTAALCSSLSTTWRRAFHPALRYGRPACAGKSRRRHGSGEPPCMRQRFPAASCRLPEQGPDR